MEGEEEEEESEESEAGEGVMVESTPTNPADPTSNALPHPDILAAALYAQGEHTRIRCYHTHSRANTHTHTLRTHMH